VVGVTRKRPVSTPRGSNAQRLLRGSPTSGWRLLPRGSMVGERRSWTEIPPSTFAVSCEHGNFSLAHYMTGRHSSIGARSSYLGCGQLDAVHFPLVTPRTASQMPAGINPRRIAQSRSDVRHGTL